MEMSAPLNVRGNIFTPRVNYGNWIKRKKTKEKLPEMYLFDRAPTDAGKFANIEISLATPLSAKIINK